MQDLHACHGPIVLQPGAQRDPVLAVAYVLVLVELGQNLIAQQARVPRKGAAAGGGDVAATLVSDQPESITAGSALSVQAQVRRGRRLIRGRRIRLLLRVRNIDLLFRRRWWRRLLGGWRWWWRPDELDLLDHLLGLRRAVGHEVADQGKRTHTHDRGDERHDE